MINTNENETKMQVFSICRRLQTMIPPIKLNSPKADETIRYWLPEIPIGLIARYKREYLEDITTTDK